MTKRTRAVGAVVAAFVACLLVPLAGSAAGPPDVTCAGTFSGTAHDLTVPAGGDCLVTGATITHDLIVLDGAGAESWDRASATTSSSTTSQGRSSRRRPSGTTSSPEARIPARTSSTRRSGTTSSDAGAESGADILRTTIGHDVQLLGPRRRRSPGERDDRPRPHRVEAATIQTGHNAPDTPGGPVKIGRDLVIEGDPGFPFVFDGLCFLDVARDLRITDRTVNLGIGVGSNCAGQRPAGQHDRA